MSIKRLQEAALQLLLETTDKRATERQLQRSFLYILRAKFGEFSRDAACPIVFAEECIYIGKSSHPKRVDYIKKGTNPILIELAVRPEGGRYQLSGKSNQSELNKLTRYTSSEARLRALLLVDMGESPVDARTLKRTYDPVLSGPGRFDRTSVRVVYVHETLQYHFLWRP